MPGPELPPDMIRLLADLRKRLAALEKRRPREVGNLDDLDDTEVLYLSPSSKPAEGDALVWDPDPSVPKFGGLWKPGWTAMPLYTYLSGAPTSSTSINLYDYGPELPSGWYAVSLLAQADPPAGTCGWDASCFISGSPGYDGHPSTIGWAQIGTTQGVWTGSTGDSGTYGWQAPALFSPITVSSFGVVRVTGDTLTVSAVVSAWTLDDPGTSAAHFGAKDTTQVAVDVTYSASAVRIAPL